MDKKKRILIVEDDADISMIEQVYLEAAGMETVTNPDGKHVAAQLKEGNFDLVLLDLMLPGKSGYAICQEIRDLVDIPILMVTARTESVDKIRGFGAGADDYISKPFDPMELVARVQSNLRQHDRMLKNDPQAGPLKEIRIGTIRIVPDSWKVYRGDEELKFTNMEFELLKYMAMNPNRVFSKDQLYERIWGSDYVGDASTVMVHINRIREKIEEDPRNPKILVTIWGAGYRLDP